MGGDNKSCLRAIFLRIPYIKNVSEAIFSLHSPNRIRSSSVEPCVCASGDVEDFSSNQRRILAAQKLDNPCDSNGLVDSNRYGVHGFCQFVDGFEGWIVRGHSVENIVVLNAVSVPMSNTPHLHITLRGYPLIFTDQ